MAHGITKDDKMFYARENGAPWHINDTRDRSVAVDEAPTSAEAIDLAGLSWEVLVRPAYFSLHGKYRKATGSNIIVRSDTEEAIGHVGGGYRPIQNVNMFSFLDELVATGDLRYETAGSLWGGRKVWMLARVPEEIVIGNDTHFPYFLAYSIHDGHGSCKVLPTTVRAVCDNTVRAAVFSRDDEVRQMTVDIRHVGDVMSKLSKAREILGLGLESFRRLKLTGDILVATDGLPYVDSLVETLFPKRDEEKEPTEGVLAKREQFREILSAEAQGRDPTAYDLFNAVTGYADHVRAVDNVRGGINTKQQARMDSVFFGGADKWKQDGLDLILNMADIYSRLEEAKVPVRLRRPKVHQRTAL